MHKKKTPKTIEYNPTNDPKRVHGYKNVRWVENASRGLRLVGFADKIVKLNHQGWFTRDDDYGSDVYRGIVYQLPARNGEAQYVYGYADPCNDDCALLCFDIVDDKEDAAQYADRFADIFAEDARDYDRAYCAGQRYRDLDSEIKELRREALDIGEEMREAKRAKMKAPKICATLRDKIMELYRGIQKARKEREQLLDDFGSQEGFAE